MLGESGRTEFHEEQQNNVAALLLCDGHFDREQLESCALVGWRQGCSCCLKSRVTGKAGNRKLRLRQPGKTAVSQPKPGRNSG